MTLTISLASLCAFAASRETIRDDSRKGAKAQRKRKEMQEQEGG
jgi:hypothetical protein